MNCSHKNECICMTCEFNLSLNCGCDECGQLGQDPFFAGDCSNYLEIEDGKPY